MGKFNSDKATGIWREIGDSQLFTCFAMAYVTYVFVFFCDCAIYAHVARSSDEVVSVVPAALQGFEARCNEKYGRENDQNDEDERPGTEANYAHYSTARVPRHVTACCQDGARNRVDRVDRVQVKVMHR